MRLFFKGILRWLLVLILLLQVSQLVLVPVAQSAAFNSEIRTRMQQVLQRDGYIGKYRNGQDLQRGMSAYLWDHRHELKTVEFHNSRQVDVLLCLLIKKGYAGFEQCLNDRAFMNRCSAVLK